MKKAMTILAVAFMIAIGLIYRPVKEPKTIEYTQEYNELIRKWIPPLDTVKHKKSVKYQMRRNG